MRPKKPDQATSRRMAGIRRSGTRIEAAVATRLRELGLGYRKNVRTLPGSPDFANRTRKWAIFVNGCFWHHHRGCGRATIPRTNTEFWKAKFKRNRSRDAQKIVALRRMGFRVAILWECDLIDPAGIDRAASKVLESRRVGVS